MYFFLHDFNQMSCITVCFIRSFPGRLLAISWWLFVILITSSYTANLAAFLTVDRIEAPIKSLEHLANQGKISYGYISNGPNMFLGSKDLTLRNLAENILENEDGVVNSFEEGFEKVKMEDFALIMPDIDAAYYVGKDCELSLVTGYQNLLFDALGLQKGV